nr:MAG TPA: hypothetical protein [Caudoviricetes sp.]
MLPMCYLSSNFCDFSYPLTSNFIFSVFWHKKYRSPQNYGTFLIC